MTDAVDRITAEWRRERPDLDPSPQAIIGRLHRVALLVTDRLNALYATFELSEADFDILATLRRAGAPYERRAGDLAAHTMVTTGGLTKRVDRLCERGLVRRETSPTDARGKIVALTDAGLHLIDRAIVAHLDNEHAILAELSPASRDALEASLTEWLRVLEPTEQWQEA